MRATELTGLTLVAAAELLRRRDLSPVELLDAVLDRIAAVDPRLNSFTTLAPREEAREAARAAEREIAHGRWRGPLHGVPVSVKDLFDTAGLRTTYGSGMFRDHVPARDATVVARLRAAGAIVTGKTATHELGMGISTNNYFYGPTRNPWNLEHVPGGSSGGSAAACAARLGALHIGSDGGGSIRFPAGWCGVVGHKPSLGLLSNVGQMGAGNVSFSTPGPLATTVRDAAVALQALAGFDAEYVYSRPEPVPDLLATLDAGVRGLRIGVPTDLLEPAPEPAVAAAFEATLARLERLGAERRPVAFPNRDLTLPGLMFAFGVEGETMLARRLGDRPRVFSPDVARMKAVPIAPTVDMCLDAARDRQLLRRDWAAAFAAVDVVVMPTAPITAPRIDTDESTYTFGCSRYTGFANLAGLPAAVIPAGFDAGLPIGMQILAAVGNDAVALRVAQALESAAAEHRVGTPPLGA